jgi:hypothetical protein
LILISGHTKDDSILTLTRSQHVNSQTDWLEMPLELSPRYLLPKQIVFHTTVPKYNVNITTDYRIDPNHDLKISFLFDHYSKLSTSWITVFDSVARKSLKKLDVYFVHDEFEIVKVYYTTKCNSSSRFHEVLCLMLYLCFFVVWFFLFLVCRW